MVAITALLLYLVTLNHWVNLRSLPVVAKVAGWDWTPPIHWPLFFLLTWPLRLLPGTIQPIALNIFTAVCSALTLGLLARSVALLPHDRTHEQRQRERSEFSLLSIRLAWLPPLLAVLVCGLELTFWEHATAVTGEALDLLIFAYLVRCLLEYRLDHRNSWLLRLAFVYGLGVANNWALIGFFPFFLIALIWIKGLSFFDPRLIFKLLLCGAIGLLLYLFLPLVWVFKSDSEFTVWEVLKADLTNQKTFLFFAPLRSRALLLALTSILPVFIMGIRWPSSFGETSVVGSVLTNFMFRTIQLVLLAACLGVALDFKLSPRGLGLGLPFLSFYYLGALAIGYYSGYVLLVFTELPRKGWHQPGISKLLNPLLRGALIVAAIAIPVALLYRNWPTIQASNGAILRSFAANIADQLPKGQAYLLSDEPSELILLEGHLRERGEAKDYVLVNTKSMQLPSYQKELRKHYGTRWPEIKNIEQAGSRLDQTIASALISAIGKTNPIIYLHPSFGYYFEKFYAEPNGPIYELHPYETNQIVPPPLTPQQFQANKSSWDKNETLLGRVERLSTLDSADARFLGNYFSRAFNTWGVYLQRANKPQEAGKAFERAERLNTNNTAALINLTFNKTVQKGKPASKESDDTLEEYLRARNMDTLLREDGKIDEPFICSRLGAGYLDQNLYHQCVEELSRTVFFQPTNLVSHLALTRAYIYGGWPDAALAELGQIRQQFQSIPATNDVELVSLESSAYFAKHDPARAESTLKKAEQDHPGDPLILQSLFAMYNEMKNYTNAIAVLDRQLTLNPTNNYVQMEKAEMFLNMEQYNESKGILDEIIKRNPTNVPALLFKSLVLTYTKSYPEVVDAAQKVLAVDPENVQATIYLGIGLMEQKDYSKATEAFTRALKKDPNNLAALRNRAIAYLRANQLDDAAKDYNSLKDLMPGSYVPFYGIAEIAEKKKDNAEAIRAYELYLKYSPTEGGPEFMEERKQVESRLKDLKEKKP
jgi:tetratricopeptide (TPR) repeat protein